MKKTTKKKQSEPKASPNATLIPAPQASTPAATTAVVQSRYPDPEALYHEAEQEEDQAVLREYARVIGVLRRKHFSYQEIAAWLNERGFETDRNEVYRIYTRTLRPDEEAQESQAADMEDATGM